MVPEALFQGEYGEHRLQLLCPAGPGGGSSRHFRRRAAERPPGEPANFPGTSGPFGGGCRRKHRHSPGQRRCAAMGVGGCLWPGRRDCRLENDSLAVPLLPEDPRTGLAVPCRRRRVRSFGCVCRRSPFRIPGRTGDSSGGRPLRLGRQTHGSRTSSPGGDSGPSQLPEKGRGAGHGFGFAPGPGLLLQSPALGSGSGSGQGLCPEHGRPEAAGLSLCDYG